MRLTELAVIDWGQQPAAPCATCGTLVPAGSGVTALFHGRTLRFRCGECYSRFVLDADHAPEAMPPSCCSGAASHEPEPDPATTSYSEWCI